MTLPSLSCWIAPGATLLITVLLFLLPGAPQVASNDFLRCRGEVLSVDNSGLETQGLLRYGTQSAEVKVLSGRHKGRIFKAANTLRADMELDKEFRKGDVVILAMPNGELPEDTVVTAQDHFRSHWFWVLGGLFALLLIAFGTWVGVKALLSIFFTFAVIWKVVVPLSLLGWAPEAVVIGAVFLMTFVIIFLVAGFNRQGAAAFSGAVSGIAAGVGMAVIFTGVMKINGAVMPYSRALYYSGFDFLDLQRLFAATLVLGASGAAMDLAVDIASGVGEVAKHNPGLSRRELLRSGISIGRSVVGTMATTLLLAYSGGYLTLLMMFQTEGHTPLSLLNNPLVAAEAVRTLLGSFGLVLVAPLTAVISAWLFSTSNFRQQTDGELSDLVGVGQKTD